MSARVTVPKTDIETWVLMWKTIRSWEYVLWRYYLPHENLKLKDDVGNIEDG